MNIIYFKSNFCVSYFMNKYVFMLIIMILSFYSCQTDASHNHMNDQISELDKELISLLKSQSPDGTVSFFILPDSDDYSNIPQDIKNPISKDKVFLGAMLFHETALGVDAKNPSLQKTYSCASCHHVEAGFQAGVVQGIGEGGMGFGYRGEMRRPIPGIENIDVQPIRSPTILNSAFQKNMLWNGQFGANGLNVGTENRWTPSTPLETNRLGFEGVETQAIAGMGVHRLNIDKSHIEMGSYKNLFDKVFGEEPEETRYTLKNAALAIAAYERIVLSNEAPFQKYLRGYVEAMSVQEKEGAKLFFGKAGCVQCHTGPALNSEQFNALGLSDLIDNAEPTVGTKSNDPVHLGRGSFTGRPSDNYKFKVPQLYNLKDSPFYGHGSSLRSIRDVIVYKNMAVAQNKSVPSDQLDPLFKPLKLSDGEISAIEAFITHALYDPNLRRYLPGSLPSGLCFPNADQESKIDLNCFP